MKTSLLALVLAAVTVLPNLANAQEEATKKKGKKANAQSATALLLKQLEVVSLTDEQTAKIKELGKVAEAAIKKVQTESGLTAAVLKKRREAAESMKDSDKKGKARAAAVNEAAGLNEAQVAAVAKANELRLKLKTDAIKLLSDEQKAKLPEALKTAAAPKQGAKKGKGNKKKDAA
jgi:hypothetical protein